MTRAVEVSNKEIFYERYFSAKHTILSIRMISKIKISPPLDIVLLNFMNEIQH